MIYFLRRADGAIKIGTTIAFTARFAQHKFNYGELDVLGFMPGSVEMEHALHLTFKRTKVEQEWFTASPELLMFIENNTTMEIPRERHYTDQFANRKIIIDESPKLFNIRVYELLLDKYGSTDQIPSCDYLAGELGTKPLTVRRWIEKRIMMIEIETLRAWCAFLDVTPADIVERAS